jgi:hypothetical protein
MTTIPGREKRSPLAVEDPDAAGVADAVGADDDSPPGARCPATGSESTDKVGVDGVGGAEAETTAAPGRAVEGDSIGGGSALASMDGAAALGALGAAIAMATMSTARQR